MCLKNMSSLKIDLKLKKYNHYNPPEKCGAAKWAKLAKPWIFEGGFWEEGPKKYTLEVKTVKARKSAGLVCKLFFKHT